VIGPDNKRLLEIWNGLPGVTPVTKFASRTVAAARIWKAIQGLEQVAIATPATQPEETATEAQAAAPEIPAAEPTSEPTQAEPPLGDFMPQPTIGPSGDADQPAGTAEPFATAGEHAPDVPSTPAESTKQATGAKKAPKAKKAAKAKDSAGPREGSKTAQVVALLQRKNGATLAEIMEKMGWQKHTVRGFMAGAMKKAGYTVESFKPEGGERTYRINQ
jgi:Protein of unknown function (DUF3489)